MENPDPNPFQNIEFKLFSFERITSRLRAFGSFIVNQVNTEPKPSHSTHYKPPVDTVIRQQAIHQERANLNQEEALLLEQRLTDQLQLDFEAQPLGDVPILPRMQPPLNRWDESGRYYEQ